MTFGMPLALLAFHRAVDRPGWRSGLVAHYVSQGMLRFIGRDRRVDDEGQEVFDVVLYQIVKYPNDGDDGRERERLATAAN